MKHRFQCSLVTLVLIFVFATTSHATTTNMTGEDIFRDVSPSVVLLMGKNRLGSGVILDNKTILTNWHVVSDDNNPLVIFKPSNNSAPIEKAPATQGTVVRVNQIKDLAIVAITTKPEWCIPITLGVDSEIAIAAEVHAIGHPTDSVWTYTKGVVSQIRNNFEWVGEDKKHIANVIQTQTPINPGNSGGPLLSSMGHLIGINSFKARGEGLNFAVSISDIKEFLQEKKSVFASESTAKSAIASK